MLDPKNIDLKTLLPKVVAIAEEAAVIILPFFYTQDTLKILTKADGSPVTEADHAAHHLIIKRLRALTPHIPIVSEESSDIVVAERLTWSTFWLIDPIDGTKEFLAKNDDFTVNIALIVNQEPVLGVIGVPTMQTVYYAAKNLKAWKKAGDEISLLQPHKIDLQKTLRVVGSRRHGKQVEATLSNYHSQLAFFHRGSSLKFCLLAEGSADFYPRLGHTSEWDTAAGQCILEQAGGCVITLTGERLRYNTKNHLQNPYFLAAADASIAWEKMIHLS